MLYLVASNGKSHKMNFSKFISLAGQEAQRKPINDFIRDAVSISPYLAHCLGSQDDGSTFRYHLRFQAGRNREGEIKGHDGQVCLFLSGRQELCQMPHPGNSSYISLA